MSITSPTERQPDPDDDPIPREWAPPFSVAPWDGGRPPLSMLAVWGLVCALPVAPVGIVLSALALREVNQRRVRGRALAITGLVASIVVVLVSGVLTLLTVFGYVWLAAVPAPTSAQEAPLAGSSDHASAAVQRDPVQLTSCDRAPGASFVTVGWRVSDPVTLPEKTVLLLNVLDPTGAEIGTSEVDLGPRVAGTRAGVVRVPIDPDDVLAYCDFYSADIIG